MRYVWAYASAGIVFLCADFVWLGYVARGFYRNNLGSLLLERPMMAPAIIFYALYVAGIVFFAVTPALRDQSWKIALSYGAALGCIAYATYDLSNLATLRNWSVAVTVVDLTWGTLVTALAATIAYAVASTVG